MKKIFISGINILIECTSPDDKRLEQALQWAGDNRDESEKVLTHYADDPEKLAAARFLIMNMPRHTGVNQSNTKKLQSVYSKYVEISEKHNWEHSSERKKDIDSLWKIEKTKGYSFSFNKIQDIKTIKTDWLINGYRLRKNYYFMAGDNGMNSQDSRYWGMLPEEYIVGKAWIIWKSVDPYTDKFRWDRFLKVIH